jgi:SecD/SecF fusion protein
VDLSGWKGGVAIILDHLSPPQKVDALQRRLRAMRLQPGFESHGWRESAVFGLAPANPGSDLCIKVMVVVADENYPLDESAAAAASTWTTELAEPEVTLVKAALTRQTSLSQVTQFDKQISDEAQTDAYIAVGLGWLVIVIYLWFRFGNIRWGVAALIALIHDLIMALGALGIAYVLADTRIGKALLLEKFRIDMSVMAAFLTVIGYSVNDTIVIFDRIRENRGRLTDISPVLINDSINQTLSRTLLTVLTVMLTLFIMYVFGGRGIHAFNYVMLVGVGTGSYSSIAIASQFLLRRRALALAKAGQPAKGLGG